MVWYSHLFKNCPQFVVIHTVKCFDVVNKTETDVCLFIWIQIIVCCYYSNRIVLFCTSFVLLLSDISTMSKL